MDISGQTSIALSEFKVRLCWLYRIGIRPIQVVYKKPDPLSSNGVVYIVIVSSEVCDIIGEFDSSQLCWWSDRNYSSCYRP